MPPSTPERSPTSWRAWIIAFLVALAVYIVSLAPGVVWQDNGLIQCRVLRHDIFGYLGLALSHPLYYVIAFAFQYLPVGESAYRTNVVSAVFGAIAVANVLLLLLKLSGRYIPAIAGATSVGVAHTFWQHASLPETYTLSAALLSTELLCLLGYCRTGRPWWIILLFFVNGLGVSNHLLALLNLPADGSLLLYLLWTRRIHWGAVGLSGLAWFVGASLYLALIGITLARGGSLHDTMISALFAGFERNVLNLHLSWGDFLRDASYLILDFPTPAILLAVVGLIAWRSEGWMLLRAMLLVLLLIHLGYAMRYNIGDQYTFFIPSIVLIGIWIGLGADVFLRKWSKGRATAVLCACALPVLVYLPLPQIAPHLPIRVGFNRVVPYRDEYNYFLHPWKTGYRGPEQFAWKVRSALPERAILLADSTTIRPFQYLQLIGRWDNKVTVIHSRTPEQTVAQLAKQPVMEKALNGELFVVSPQPQHCADWLLRDYTTELFPPVYRATPRQPSSKAAPSS